jgi:hypothetical protein
MMNRSTVNRAPLVWALLLGLILTAFGSAHALDGKAGNDGRFTGESLPEPPFEHRPWTPPHGPKNPDFDALIETTRLLFENGMSDPRGCEYRRIRIPVGSSRSESATGVETRGWVLPLVESTDGGSPNGSPGGPPTRNQSARRFAVCWNGLVYPVVSVGERRDLDRDIEAIFAKFKKHPEFTLQGPRMDYSAFQYSEEMASVSPETITGIKCPLLLRLGKVDRARQIDEARGLSRPRFEARRWQEKEDPSQSHSRPHTNPRSGAYASLFPAPSDSRLGLRFGNHANSFEIRRLRMHEYHQSMALQRVGTRAWRIYARR